VRRTRGIVDLVLLCARVAVVQGEHPLVGPSPLKAGVLERDGVFAKLLSRPLREHDRVGARLALRARRRRLHRAEAAVRARWAQGRLLGPGRKGAAVDGGGLARAKVVGGREVEAGAGASREGRRLLRRPRVRRRGKDARRRGARRGGR
jgi:hypothetical protein